MPLWPQLLRHGAMTRFAVNNRACLTLDEPWRRPCRALQVGGGGLKKGGVFDALQVGVAFTAQQTAHRAGVVAVVDAGSQHQLRADQALSSLGGQKRVVVFGSHSVEIPEVVSLPTTWRSPRAFYLTTAEFTTGAATVFGARVARKLRQHLGFFAVTAAFTRFSRRGPYRSFAMFDGFIATTAAAPAGHTGFVAQVWSKGTKFTFFTAAQAGLEFFAVNHAAFCHIYGQL